MQRIVYLDHAATTPVRKEVLEEMIPYFTGKYGNPSSYYILGTEAKEALELARGRVAKALNAESDEIFFTSGGSESDNLAIKGIAFANKDKGNHIITTKIEHHAVLDACKTLENFGFKVTYLNVYKDGFINIEELKREINSNTILISIMFANNEIGTIEPIKEIGEIARENNIIFHTDAVQAVGNVKIDVKEMNIDLLSISGHKLYAPKGVGALYIRNGIKIQKIQDGGHQEKNRRAGTENIPGIVGLGKAMELAYNGIDKYTQKLEFLRNYYIEEIKKNLSEVKINGSMKNRLPGNANISFENIRGEELLLHLSIKGICASSGSACNTDSSEPSHVLKAIGLSDDLANSALRVTLGEENTKDDIDYLIEQLKRIVPKLRK